jgi:hypothetical protein
MSDAIPLPPRPNLEQYKKLAKDFQRASKSRGPDAFHDWSVRWAESMASVEGRKITPEIKRKFEAYAEQVDRAWLRFEKTHDITRPCPLADAQFFIAHTVGFASWPKFARHLAGLERVNSPVSKFEAAVNAIVSGDFAALDKLLRESPELVRARSTRKHRSTLLHYVSANGVEDFRQKTPKNIVEIATLLLKAGADVNAESDAYGGRSTTLGLTATSCHPENAGVQLPLMELLIDHGAIIDGPDGGSAVNGCLHNGRGQAAGFFANRGAWLDLEGAAGVGRLDVVMSFFQADGSLKPPATQEQMGAGFAWACEFGRTNVVDFLLQRGMALDVRLKHDGQTGLHWAAYGGHADTVKLLLERGAPIDAKDERYDGTPLGWALYGWGNRGSAGDPAAGGSRDPYYEVVALLARAGAKLDPQWYEDDEDRHRAAEKMRSDPRMVAALGGEALQ